MKQPTIKVTDIHGKDLGTKKVMSVEWKADGEIWMVLIDFMESGNSKDYSAYFKQENEFRNIHGNLKGELC